MSATSSTGHSSKKLVFSGAQPTGGLMLGNYLGAIRNWVALQDDPHYETLYCVVDLHAITVKQEASALREKSYENLAVYLACGLDPKKSTIFLQSQVPQHAELAWILGCNTYMGELSRMTQFKDKSAKQKNIGTGLLTYPVLMAADILLYRANLVPVGQDQKQHLELTRDLAIRMNSTFGELFPVPEVFIPPQGAKVMSLQDPLAKMSKSDPITNATVFIRDTDDVIRSKIKRAVTDSGSEITYTDEKPGVKNLINLQTAITGKSSEEIVSSYVGKQYGHLKLDTAEIVISCIKPIRERFEKLMSDQIYLNGIFKNGAEQATVRADSTLKAVKQAMGFIVG